jgi:O-antigen ligase
MIESLIDSKKILHWITFHILLGLGVAFSKWVIIGWYYLIILVFLYKIINDSEKSKYYILLFLVYTAAFEILCRMSKCSPYIPYEVGKYCFLLFIIIGLITSYRQNYLSLISFGIILLLIPSTLIDESGKVKLPNIIFNSIGLVNISLGMLFFSSLKVSLNFFYSLLRVLIYPIIAILILIYVKSPRLSDIEFSLGAMSETTGGFGPNQVSTVLGLAFFITVVSLIINQKIFYNRYVELVLSVLFLIQGLLSFSRGGVIGAIVSILVFIFIISKMDPHLKKRFKIPNVIYLIVLPSIFCVVSFLLIDNLTGGVLLQRYRGETEATLKSRRDVDINTITSGRADVFEEDIQIWLDNPILGVGIGASRFIRQKHKNVSAHTEFSRMLAEQGVLGLCIMLLLGIAIYMVWKKNDPLLIKAWKLSLISIAILSSFHSATRTFVTPLMFSLAFLQITNVKLFDRSHKPMSI